MTIVISISYILLFCCFLIYEILSDVSKELTILPLSPFNPMGPLNPGIPGIPAAPLRPLSPGGPAQKIIMTADQYTEDRVK